MSGAPEDPVGLGLDAEAMAEELLTQPMALEERAASVRADTWHRLRRSALELDGRRAAPKPIVSWSRVGVVGLVACFALLAFVLVRGAWLRLAPSEVNPSADQPRGEADGWTEFDLGTVGRLFVAPGASYRLPPSATPDDSEYRVDLDRGEVCAQVAHRDPVRQGPFVVQTATLRAVAIGTRFCVFAAATAEESWVIVEEGRVRVERGGEPNVMAGPGSLVRGSDRAAASGAQPESTSPATPPSNAVQPGARRVATECVSGSRAAQENCLWRHASRSDLGAQNALYLLGAMSRDEAHDGPGALSIWQIYLQRFPRGVLVDETRWAIFDELVDERKYDEAVALSDDFRRASPTYFRLGELDIKRGDLLSGQLDRPREAEQAYRDALGVESRPFLREKARFALGSCQERLGDRPGARASWEVYLQEFPQGAHATEVVNRLAALEER